MKKIFFSLVMVVVYYPCFTQAELQSGPMLGYSGMREVAIWVQTKKEAEVQVEYWLESESLITHWTSIRIAKKEKAYTAVLIADEVEPGKHYKYKVLVDGIPVRLPYEAKFQAQPLWKWRTDPPEFTLAAGSCAYINEEQYDRPGEPYGSGYEIFGAIHRTSPDFMIWLGDNTYFREPDWDTWAGITKRWTHTRSIPELQPLLASVHHYAVWDDHDYGPNDSDRGFWNKNRTLEAFKLFWANPSYGVGNIRGAITQFQWGDVDFILLDNRFHRTPNHLEAEEKTILGEEQKQWLKDALVYSKSTFKVIVMGGQFLNDAAKFELYSNNGFNKERQEIIDFIYKHNLKNVIFLTGDRHHTELSLLEENGEPRIIDLTVSALTSGASNNKGEKNTLRIPGTYTNKHNYGLLTFRGAIGEREVNIQIRDKKGDLIWEKKYKEE